ncbi:MAG TPA: outer membrane beta-barrel protein [Chitinophagaceae bacterium]|nr:outer membrane beta-barrel protein [Chitinophagaceae bacterium]
MLYKRSALIILFGISIALQLNAQSQQVIIQFRFENGQPAEKASVLLKPLTPGGVANAFLTNGQGIIILATDNILYSLSAAFTGMEPVNDTLLADGKKDTIRYTFRQHFTELTAVQISSRKKILEVKDDRFIYNVGADSSARSKSISQVLSNLPFVTVDGSGNVQVAGQTTYKVLLNGKETALFVTSVAQALRSFPAEIVSRIELITAPGARYDAEGITAIINIITKKFAGYKGFNYSYLSDRSHYSDGLTLTGRTGKLGITVNGNIDGTFKSLKGYTTTLTKPLQTSAYEERTVSGENTNKRTSLTGTMELSYEIDSLHSLIGYATAGKNTTDDGLQQDVNTRLSASDNEQGFIVMNSTDKSPSLTAGLDYTQKSKKNPAKELSFRFNWNGTRNTINNTTAQEYDAFNKWMINHSVARNDEYTFQLDAIPVALQKFTLEAGAKAILRRASTDYTSLFTFDKNNEYAKDANNSNSFNYRQQVYAAYASMSAKIKNNNLRAGVRLEQTGIKGVFSNLPDPVNDDYLSVIPNLYWSLKINQTSTASLSYNLNLLRPYITNLNPYVNNTDSFNISYGNPELGPQQIHKVVAQFRYNTEKMFVSTTLTGSWSNDRILSYRLFEASTGITTTTFGNVGKEQMISFGASIRNQFSKTFSLGLWGDIRYVDVRNRFQKSQHNHGYSGVGGAYFNWEFSKGIYLSGSGGANISDVNLLGRRSPYYFYQINSGFDIIKNKLYVTINWNNVHASYFTQRTTFADDAVSSVTTTKRVYRVIFLGIQYTFGKLRQEVARKKGVVNDDILR